MAKKKISKKARLIGRDTRFGIISGAILGAPGGPVTAALAATSFGAAFGARRAALEKTFPDKKRKKLRKK